MCEFIEDIVGRVGVLQLILPSIEIRRENSNGGSNLILHLIKGVNGYHAGLDTTSHILVVNHCLCRARNEAACSSVLFVSVVCVKQRFERGEYGSKASSKAVSAGSPIQIASTPAKKSAQTRRPQQAASLRTETRREKKGAGRKK